MQSALRFEFETLRVIRITVVDNVA
jgi:hypothetical protein